MITRSLDKLLRVPLRIGMSGLYLAMRLHWFATRPRARGAHSFALTPAGRLVLVRLRYARGWRLPGGGVRSGESARDAAIRELTEEIGLTGWESIRPAFEDECVIDFRRDSSNLFIVEGVTYSPRWSLEIEEITECAPGRPPPDLSPRVADWLERARPLLRS